LLSATDTNYLLGIGSRRSDKAKEVLSRLDDSKWRQVDEGKYILKTDYPDITEVEAVACYKELNTVEQGFRDLKDVIDMRPIYHKTDERVEAHIFVASLALFLKQTLQYQLASKLPEISATDALAAVKSIGLTELTFNDQTKRLVSNGGRDAKAGSFCVGY